MTLSPQLIAATIPDDPDLAKSVQDLVKTSPESAPVITRLLAYFQTKQGAASVPAHGHIIQQQSKQSQGIAQFFNRGGAPTTTSTLSAPASTSVSPRTSADIGPAIYTTSALSFLHPVRKKLVLSLHSKDIALTTATPAASTPEIICSAPYKSLYRVIAVPFLERTTKQTALLLFFRHSDALVAAKDAIWVVPLPDDGKDFTLHFHEQHRQLAGLSEDLRSPSSSTKPPIPLSNGKRPDSLLISILSHFLQTSNPTFSSDGTVDIIQNPSPAYPNFLAHLKSNQGTIYLLPTGILFAFRKPILFLRSESIEAVGVHSVLSRTFDFEVVMRQDPTVVTAEDLEGVPAENKDGRRAVGFGMVDTKEFARMEEWIKKAGIRDRSLSEDLKAKDKAPVSATGASSKKRERTADGGGEGVDGNDSEGGGSQVSVSQRNDGTKAKKQRGTVQGGDDDEDDDEDDDFAPESDDEIMEEYDSDAVGSDSDGGEENVPVRRKKVDSDDEGEVLGDEDSDDEDEDEEGDEDEEADEDEEDEDEDEDEEQNEEGVDLHNEDEVDELLDD
ncbi:hypothetical protein BGZ98_007777 [Dissophora globulifera]|nr:hypothetical protein BGZ98_007777 [Dissophora globulifera]